MAANPGYGDAVPRPRTGIVGAVALAALITAVDLADDARPSYDGLLIGPPFLAAAFAGHRAVLAVGALCAAGGIALGLVSPEGMNREQVIRIVAIVLATGLAAAV